MAVKREEEGCILNLEKMWNFERNTEKKVPQ
jgi:hypothetical protein